MMSAVLSNPNYPKYGVVTIPFPIPRDQYTYCMDLLEALEIGDAVKADCKVVEFDSAYNVLKRMEQCTVNVDELNALDGKKTARQLIESGSGTITPYGVVYDNGMKLEQFYQGREFPCYYYEPNPLTIALTSKAEPEDTEHITWLHLPMEQEEIDRALLRGGITDSSEIRLRLEDSQLPNEVDVLLDMEYETLSDLNELAEATDGLSNADMEKLGAVVMLAEPKSAAQIKNLAESLDLFDFAPDAHSPAEYGKYMIQQSGHFDYDENLDAFYDYEKYGTERMNAEDGMFTDRGYIAYKGYISMEEVMNGSQSSRMAMGGLSR